MKTKRKSLGEYMYGVIYDAAWGRFNESDDSRKVWARIASRIRREVIKREMEKAEDDLGVRAIHGESAERAKLMLESRRRERGQACTVRDVATGCVASGGTQAEATAALVQAMNPERRYKEGK